LDAFSITTTATYGHVYDHDDVGNRRSQLQLHPLFLVKRVRTVLQRSGAVPRCI